MNNLEHIIEKILVYYFCHEYIILPSNYFEIITPKIPNLLIITNNCEMDFTNKQIATKNWESYTNEFKLNLMMAEKIIIFSDFYHQQFNYKIILLKIILYVAFV